MKGWQILVILSALTAMLAVALNDPKPLGMAYFLAMTAHVARGSK